MKHKTAFGQLLRARRKRLDYRQYQIPELLGEGHPSLASIVRWEAGKTQPTGSVLRALCALLEIDALTLGTALLTEDLDDDNSNQM